MRASEKRRRFSCLQIIDSLMRTFTYRIYFTRQPTTYVALGGKNAKDAIRRAKRFARSTYGQISFGRGKLVVLKVERLTAGAEVKLLKIVG